MVDPRIAARRAEVEAESQARERRHRRRWAVGATAVTVLLSAGALVGLSPMAGVSEIQVFGAQRTGPAAVRAASGLEHGPPLVRVDAGRVTARLRGLAWVKTARLERRLPRTVVLTIEERVPAAVAPCAAAPVARCLVDTTGRVLAPASDPAGAGADLPQLSGVAPAGEPGSQLDGSALGALAVATSLPSALSGLVLAVRDEGGEVALDLRASGREKSPPVVRLGHPDRIQDKLTAAATVLARTSVNGVGVLDVRVPESPALTRVRR